MKNTLMTNKKYLKTKMTNQKDTKRCVCNFDISKDYNDNDSHI